MSIKYLLVKPPNFNNEYVSGAFTTPKDFDNTNNFIILIGGGGSGGSGTFYRDPDTTLFRRSSGGGGGGGACIFAENIQLTPGEQYQYTVPGRNSPLTSFSSNSLASESFRQDRSQSTRLWGAGVDLEAESGEPGESGWHSNIYGSGGTVLNSIVTADRTLVYAGGRGGFGVNSSNMSNPLRYMSGAGGGGSAGPNGRGGNGGSGRNENYTSSGNQNAFAGSGGGSNGGDDGTNLEPTTFANQSLGGDAGSYSTPYRSSVASGIFRGSDGGPGFRFSSTWATNPGGLDDLIECHSTDSSGIIQFIFPASTNNLFNGNLGQSIQADSQSYDVIDPGSIYNLRTSGGGSGGGGLGSAGGAGGGNADWPGGGGGGGGGASSGNYFGGMGSAGFMLIVWKSTTDSHLNFC